MPQTILGIDVGSYSIKVAQIKRTFKSFELVKFYEKQIEYNDVLSPEEATSATLTSLIEDNALTWDQAIVGMGGQHVSSRLIDLPFSSKKKIDQTIEFELESFIPFAIEDVIADYHVVRSTKESSKVLVAYATNAQFIKFLTMLSNSNVDPRLVCVEGIELVNLVNLGMVPPEGDYALVDVGHSKTTITICKGKTLTHTRVVGVGGKRITESIANKLGVPVSEAEKLKIELGQIYLDEPTGVDNITRQVNEAIRNVIDDLVLHLKQTFFAYQDEEGESVSGIFLSGGTSRLPGLDRYFSIKLRQNVTFLDCLEFHFSRLEKSEVHLQLIPQALALGLRGVAPAGLPDVNFRRGEFAFKGDVQQLGGGIRRMGIAAGLVFVLAVSYFGMNYYFLSKKLDSLNKDVSAIVLQALPDTDPRQVNTAERALKTIKSKKSEISDRLSKLEEAVGLSVLDVVKDVSAGFPTRDEVQVDIEDFNFSTNTIKMVGRTTSFEAVDKIKLALEKSGKFKDIATGNVRKGVKDEIKFDLTMELQK